MKETKGYQDFLKEHARKMLAEVWIPEYVNTGILRLGVPGVEGDTLEAEAFEFCCSKRWVGAKRDSVTGAGFKVAAAYLRR